MKSRLVSVTGATGFVGWHVAEHFVREGWQVRGIVRRGNRKPVPAGVHPVESDLEASELADACAGSDVIVHSAGVVRAPHAAVFTAVNVEGAVSAAAAAARLGARLVLISSQAAVGQGTPTQKRREDDPASPVNAYGRSKLASEAVVRASNGVRWTILRPASVFGPRDRGFLPLFRLAKWGLFPMPTRPEMPLTFLYAEDLARAVRLAAENEEAIGKAFFVGHEEPGTPRDILSTIAKSMGRRYRPMRIPGIVTAPLAMAGDFAWRVGLTPLIDSGRLAELRADGFVCSVLRARRVLGFQARTSLEEGIARTAEWYRKAGWV